MKRKSDKGNGKNRDWLGRTASLLSIVRSFFALRDSNAFHRVVRWLFDPL